MNENKEQEQGETLQGKGCLRFGCGVIAFLLLLVLLFIGRFAYRSYIKYSERYIAKSSESLPELLYTESAAVQLRDKVLIFSKSLDGTEKSMQLSAEELNILMRSAPEAAALSGILHFFVENENLKGEVSLDLGPLDIKDRFLNGDATLLFMPETPLPALRMISVDVRGERLPPRLTAIVHKVNFFAALALSSEQSAFLRRLQDIRVTGKTIVLTFR